MRGNNIINMVPYRIVRKNNDKTYERISDIKCRAYVDSLGF